MAVVSLRNTKWKNMIRTEECAAHRSCYTTKNFWYKLLIMALLTLIELHFLMIICTNKAKQ